jgi:hypothetical protein
LPHFKKEVAKMPFYDDSTQYMIADHILGLRVDRAASVTPQHGGTDDVTYFTVYAGRILMTLLVGEVTASMAAGANSVNIYHTPGAGALAAIAAATSIASYAEGDILTITGLLTDTMLPAVTAGASHSMTYGGVILVPGTIKFNATGATTGNWKWSLWYFPLEEGAYVTAA